VCAWRSRSRWPRARSPRHQMEMMRRLPSFKSDLDSKKRSSGRRPKRKDRDSISPGSVRGRAETETRWEDQILCCRGCVLLERRKERKKNWPALTAFLCPLVCCLQPPEVPTLHTAVVLVSKRADTSLLSYAPTPLLQAELLSFWPINSPKCEVFTCCRLARCGQSSPNSTQRLGQKND
jgi:hypothetical protein